ncbi:BglG family transcription antiterminator [Demequina pelophila]|uniref:BglG family transcription antiterminator n=1 Tax=Demequina pelophila TaxID=1638984 RepID=UPI00078088DA|nr:PTS sugar transporter subunit IIA [Demequina pelophila]
MTIDRREALLRELRHASAPVPGAVLATALEVTSRTIRQDVKALNARAGTTMVQASHQGYTLDIAMYQRYRSRQGHGRRRIDTPRQRLCFIAREVVAAPEGVSVDDLTQRLAVSFETIEADLTRVRELFVIHDLRLRRDRSTVRVEGSERNKRRLVRQVLLDAAEGANPAALHAFEQDYPDLDVRALRRSTRAALAACDLNVNEYALNDLVIHLVIAADRVRAGHTIDSISGHTGAQAPALDGVVEAIETMCGTTLPPEERALLCDIIVARFGDSESPDTTTEVRQLVHDSMRVVSEYYGLEVADERSLSGLSLHVQTLLSRARTGRGLRNPLGGAFKSMHPLLHEMALLFASALEARAGVQIRGGEVDFLSFHLGTLFQRELERGPMVRVSCVVPQYHDLHTEAARRLREATADAAVVEDIITALDHDWSQVTTDLVVSAVDLGPDVAAPVVRVSPFMSADDIARVRSAIASERARISKQQLRSQVLSLVDPALFHAVERAGSREEALERMCATMHREGYVDEAFIDDVLDRERRSSTAFGPQFAVPHSLLHNARATGISVMVADRAMPWGDASVRLVVLLAVSPDQRAVFRTVLDQLIGVLNDPASVSALLSGARCYASFVRTLGGLLDR